MFNRTSVLGLMALSLSGIHCAGDNGSDDEPNDAYADEWNSAYEQNLKSSSCSGVRVPDAGPFDKRVALTFDDGPSLQTTPQVLETLAKYDIKATFLINGSRVSSDAHRQLLQQMLEAGHIVGNHTHSHENSVKLSESAFRSQVERTTEVISAAGATPKYFRFPFGSSNCSTAAIVRDYGYFITGWHVDTADWCFASSTGGVGHCASSTFKHVPNEFRDDMIGLAVDQVHRYEGGIVLFHDIHQNTADNLEGFISRLAGEGYTFVNVDDVNTFPVLNGAVPTDAWIGTPCATHEECDFDPTGYCMQGASSGVCSIPCSGYCPDKGGYGATFCADIDPAAGAGACAIKAEDANNCADIEGSHSVDVSRYVGTSSAPAAQAAVCLPQ